jgi:CDP-diacylglycerol--serine O-phosphatidyltransferase
VNEEHPQPVQMRRGIYLLPNLFTTAALFAGFYAIVHSMRGQFISAPIAIFVAMLLDFLDGRVARLTHTQTAFGAEYDSLSDLVAFGLAPSLVIYTWSLVSLGKLGWLVAFIYAAATALRLARFNSRMQNQDKTFFYGLPSPPGAAVIAAFVWVCNDLGWSNTFIDLMALFLTLVIALLMVSNIRYRSLKDFDLKGKVPFVALLITVCIFVLVAIDPPEVLFIVFFLYALSGPAHWFWSKNGQIRLKRLWKSH